MMPALETAELTVQERGILASSASAAYLDYFSKADRFLLSTFQQPALIPRQRQYYSRGLQFTVQWQDYGQPLPAWFDPLMQGFVDLMTLPPNWDSYGAGPIDQRVIHEAMSMINGLLVPASPAPRIVPLSSGGLQLEWHRRGVDLEVVFDREGPPFFYYQNSATGEEADHQLPQDNALLKSIIGNLA
jgi:hypothetical protein